MKSKGPWQAWVGSALAAVFTLFYLVGLSIEGVESEDVPGVAGISLSLIAGSVFAGLAAWARNRRAAVVLLVLALIPLLVWGILGAMTIGGLFLVAASFLIAALTKVASWKP